MAGAVTTVNQVATTATATVASTVAGADAAVRQTADTAVRQTTTTASRTVQPAVERTLETAAQVTKAATAPAAPAAAPAAPEAAAPAPSAAPARGGLREVRASRPEGPAKPGATAHLSAHRPVSGSAARRDSSGAAAGPAAGQRPAGLTPVVTGVPAAERQQAAPAAGRPDERPSRPERDAPAAGGGSAASGVSTLFLFGGLALLVGALLLGAPRLDRRLVTRPVRFRSVVFVALLERPG